jgi:hypothetical protein
MLTVGHWYCWPLALLALGTVLFDHARYFPSISHCQDNDDELDCSNADVKFLLNSLVHVNCNYVLQGLDMQVFTALRLQFRGSDKQKPSMLDLVSSFAAVVDFKSQLNPRVSKRDLFEAAVTEFNATVAVRSYKVTGSLKDAIRNVMRCPPAFRAVLHGHYDSYKHECSALNVSNLVDNSFVPGSNRCANKSGVWNTILLVTDDGVVEWVKRVVGDFERTAPKSATVKAKDGRLVPCLWAATCCRDCVCRFPCLSSVSCRIRSWLTAFPQPAGRSLPSWTTATSWSSWTSRSSGPG